MREPCIGDSGAAEVKVLKSGQPFEMLQPSIRDFSIFEVQPIELGLVLRVLQAAIGDSGTAEP